MKAARAWLLIIAILTCLNMARAQWSEPINVGPPINSATQELRPSITPFADMMVFKTGRGYESGLFTSRYIDGQWTAPQYVYSVGNPANLMPALSPDGNEIYFSCYCGGYGDYDIWKTVYDTVSGEWATPENAGPNVNDPGGQLAPFVSYDGQKLYFIDRSNRFPPGLMVSYKNGDEWTYPERVHSYFAAAEDATLTMDERTIYFGKAVPDEIWAVFFSEKDNNGNWAEPRRFDEINDYGTPVYPRVSADGSRVYFSSGDMGGEGGFDIWYVERATAIDEHIEESELDLMQVYPNPSNSTFNILVAGTDNSGCVVSIYDIMGRELASMILPGDAPALRWPKQGQASRLLSSGIYFAVVRGEGGEVKDHKCLVYLK